MISPEERAALEDCLKRLSAELLHTGADAVLLIVARDGAIVPMSGVRDDYADHNGGAAEVARLLAAMVANSIAAQQARGQQP